MSGFALRDPSHVEPGLVPAGILAVLVHLLFLGFLIFGLSWRTYPPESMVVDLWSSLPQPIIPVAPALPPPQPVQPPAEAKPLPPKPEVPELPPPPKPDIALKEKIEKPKPAEKKQQVEKEQKERKEKELTIQLDSVVNAAFAIEPHINNYGPTEFVINNQSSGVTKFLLVPG